MIPAYAQLALLNASLPAALGVTVLTCSKSHPECFATIEDVDERKASVAKLREELEAFYSVMRESYGVADLLVSTEVDENERQRGLVKVTSRRGPGFSLSYGDWPALLARVVADQAERETKRAA